MSTMSAPFVVNATFLLSGLLGLQVQIPDGNGNIRTINQSVPFSVRNSFEPTIRVENNDAGRSLFDQPPKYSHNLNRYPGNQVSDSNTGIRSSTSEQRCGSRYCDSTEICVSWELEDTSTSMRSRPSNRQPYQECHKADGSDYTKTNPRNNLTANLCPHGMTHSLVSQPSESANRSCGLAWKYKCVLSSASPHSCQLKKCPTGFLCFEQVHCELQSPCYTQAVCEDDSQVYIHHR